MTENPYKSPEAEGRNSFERRSHWRKIVWIGAILVVLSPFALIAGLGLELRHKPGTENRPLVLVVLSGAAASLTLGIAALVWGCVQYNRENTRRFRESLLRSSQKQEQ